MVGRSADCALAQMGRCGAPCTGSQSVEDYAAVVAEAAAVLGGDAREVVSALHERMGLLAGQERFEDAGAVRDRMLHLVRAAARAQRLAPLAASPEVVAARRSADGGWEVVCAPENFERVREAVKALGVEPASTEVAMIPQNYVKLTGKEAQQMLKLMEVIEEHDDVQHVWANFDIEEKEIEASLA